MLCEHRYSFDIILQHTMNPDHPSYPSPLRPQGFGGRDDARNPKPLTLRLQSPYRHGGIGGTTHDGRRASEELRPEAAWRTHRRRQRTQLEPTAAAWGCATHCSGTALQHAQVFTPEDLGALFKPHKLTCKSNARAAESLRCWMLKRVMLHSAAHSLHPSAPELGLSKRAHAFATGGSDRLQLRPRMNA